jgi:hypothetical protein
MWTDGGKKFSTEKLLYFNASFPLILVYDKVRVQKVVVIEKGHAW